MSKLSTAINQRKSRTLRSDIVQNPRNDSSVMAITTRIGKILPYACTGALSHINDLELEEKVYDVSTVESATLGDSVKKSLKVEQPAKPK